MSFDDIHIAQCLNYFQHQIKQNNRKLFGQISAFIMPKPCGFSTPRTRMPAGILRSDIHVWQQPYLCATSTGATVDVGHALQRRDSGRYHLRLIFVSLSDRTQKIQYKLFPITNENGVTKSPQSTQRAQNSTIPATTYEKAAVSRFRTRMTRIARIFTDPFASAQSVFLPAIRTAV
ncbi:MAG: hypothetical protein O8C61_09885 [Candidatus Methanoperedens sp.]|nr:hypothetical protein [Candidatus Methanoperedens sp.]